MDFSTMNDAELLQVVRDASAELRQRQQARRQKALEFLVACNEVAHPQLLVMKAKVMQWLVARCGAGEPPLEKRDWDYLLTMVKG